MVKHYLKNKIKNYIAKQYKDSNINKIISQDFYNPYLNLEMLKTINVTKINKDYEKIDNIQFSLVTPIKNEEDSIIEFLKSIENQTQIPTEIFIVDGGSTDKTIELIKGYLQKTKLSIQLFTINSKSISEQRNLGIRKSTNEFIVLADAGNILHKDYCLNLIGAFLEYPDADLVGAIYYALDNQCAEYFIYDWENFNGWYEFLPAGKTMAIKKSLALSIGGFPEFLSYAGEDALFDIKYRAVSNHWVFNSNSFVYWDIPKNIEDTIKKFRAYGEGLGENVMGDFQFYEKLSSMRLNRNNRKELLIIDALFEGYLKGRDRRGQIEFEKRSVNKVIILFSEENVMDSSVITKVKDLIEKNNKVIFISSNRGIFTKKYLDFDFTLLEIFDSNDFLIEDIWRRYGYYKDKINVETLGEISQSEIQNLYNEIKVLISS